MPMVMDSDYVCKAIGCQTPIDPTSLMCMMHWELVPPMNRWRLQEAYRQGQELTKTPSAEYTQAVKDAVNAVYAIERANQRTSERGE